MRLLAVALLLMAGWVLTASGRPRPHARARALGRRIRWPSAGWARGGRSDVARVLVEVATRLRAGTQLAQAWRRSLPDPPPAWAGQVMSAAGAGAVPAGVAAGPRQQRSATQRWWWHRRERESGPDVAAAVAACRLAARTGAPLAEVIDVVVAGVAEAAEADELRRTALAGPRATARLLAWLPAGGIALGSLVGADPLAVLLGGGVGGLCLVGGGALFLLGHRWVRALVTDAERAGR